MPAVKQAELGEFTAAVQSALAAAAERFEQANPRWQSRLAEVTCRVAFRMERASQAAPLQVMVDLDEPARLLTELVIPIARVE